VRLRNLMNFVVAIPFVFFEERIWILSICSSSGRTVS